MKKKIKPAFNNSHVDSLLRVNERSSDSYIYRDDFFFQEKSIVHAQIYLSVVDFRFLFKFIFMVKKANSTIEQQKCNSREKRSTSSFESGIYFQISQPNKNLTYCWNFPKIG